MDDYAFLFSFSFDSRILGVFGLVFSGIGVVAVVEVDMLVLRLCVLVCFLLLRGSAGNSFSLFFMVLNFNQANKN